MILILLIDRSWAECKDTVWENALFFLSGITLTVSNSFQVGVAHTGLRFVIFLSSTKRKLWSVMPKSVEMSTILLPVALTPPTPRYPHRSAPQILSQSNQAIALDSGNVFTFIPVHHSRIFRISSTN